jgi:predicted dehydrogenase
MNAKGSQHTLNRRAFLRSAAAGAALAVVPAIDGGTEHGDEPEPINVALLGAGGQGETLTADCLKIPGVRFRAVCDIWESYNLLRASRWLQRSNHPATAYTDFEEMLDREKGLNAVIVATPDFWHARHTVACLDKGLHVYCETPMSNTVEEARSMVEAARKAGTLLQIGHQRRSNPRYIYCREKVLTEMKLLGQVIAADGQWDRAVQSPLGWPKYRALDDETLRKYGYASMRQLRNWRWYKGLGGGPAVDLGSQQIDVYNWLLGARPRSVMASGRSGYYRKEGFEWPDSVMVIYEYDTPQGPVNASYRVLSANSSFGYFEVFMGDQGTLVISEDSLLGDAFPEPQADSSLWAKWVEKGYLKSPRELSAIEKEIALPVYLVAETPPPFFVSKEPPYKLPVKLDKPRHQPHLENFFDAIRGRAKLNCPGEVGYETAVTVLKINEAIETGHKIEFKPADFVFDTD